ncbi:MAG: L,D-transpeptidase [Candidatus Berkelbacteria bacterium]|nr:L,D-transpeptidase [Candidatus Berkelbacteria bacterium]
MLKFCLASAVLAFLICSIKVDAVQSIVISKKVAITPKESAGPAAPDPLMEKYQQFFRGFGEKRFVPDNFNERGELQSQAKLPKPVASPKLKSSMKIVITIHTETLQLYDKGKLIFSTKVSTAKSGINVPKGKRAPLRKVWDKKRKHWKWVEVIHNQIGVFKVLDKNKMAWSQAFHCKMPWCLHIWEGHCIHQCPGGTQGMLGRPASHGCIRMFPVMAKKLFQLAPVGTEVVIKE